MRKNIKGFTLLEILAVIIILGVLLIIAVPSISNYINDSRKEAYIATAKEYIKEAQKKVNSFEYEFFDRDTSYYININDLPLESGGQSPFGEWVQAYVVVTYIPKDKWEYYWISVDSAGMKVDITKAEDLDIDDIYQSKKLYINDQAPAGTRNNVEIYESGKEVTKTTQKIIMEREKVDECYSFKLNESAKTATITYYDKTCGTDLMIPSVIEDGDVQYTINEIYSYAFNNMGIKSVIIPKTVTKIGSRAFAYNPLTRVVLPPGLITIDSEAFLSCKLPAVQFPNTLKTIGARAFRNNKISNVNVPASVTSLGACAFCDNPIPNPSFLYVINNGVTDYSRIRGYIGDLSEFSGKKFIIPAEVNGVKLVSIESSAFSSMSLGGWEVVIPDTVTSIGSSAFNASGIGKVNLPDGLKTIGSSAFYNNRLTEIIIPDSVTSLGSLAFNINQTTDPEQMYIYKRTTSGIDYSTIIGYSGKNRANVEIPPSKNGVALKTIANGAFRYLSLTGTIKIPASVTKIEQLAFNLNNLTSVDNGDGRTNAGPFVYNRKSDGSIDYTSLNCYAGQQTANVVVPSTVKRIENYAFYYSYIKGVTIPEGVEYIGSNAFELCRIDKSVTIPSTVTTIGSNAFAKRINWTTQNSTLTKIINKTGRTFNWQSITAGPSPATFVTGNVENWYGDIEVTDN